MAERSGDWSDRVAWIEKKVDSLAASVDVHFEEVTGALLEQRRYTEFAFRQLEEKMDSRFVGVDSRFTQLQERMDSRFAQVDSHFARLERKLDQLIDRA